MVLIKLVHCELFYHKWVDISNILEMVERLCHLKLKTIMFMSNTVRFGIRLFELLNVRFDSELIYDDKYIKTKVNTFSSIINTLFSGNKIPKERIHFVYIPVISIDSVLKRADKKNYPPFYLEQCKYKIKKRELKNFIDYEVDLS